MRKYLLAAVSFVVLTGCIEDSRPRVPDNRQQQQRAAADAAASVRFTNNAEIANIKRRLELTANPDLLGYIVLLNEAGQPIMYETVMGKVTTSGSRLTSPDQIDIRSGANNHTASVVRAPSDTGTFDTGTASFIFYWNTSGQYRQWSGDYLYSDQPLRLRVEPLIVNIQN